MDAIGLPPHPGMQGHSIYDCLTDAQTLFRGDDSIYCEYYNAMPYHTAPTAQLTMLRTVGHKIVVDHANDDGELYDLNADPLEKANLWQDKSALELKVKLLTKLTHRMAFTVDPLPPRISEW
jgi:hypothetical protein